MSVNKTDLIAPSPKESECRRHAAEKAVDATFDAITESLEAAETT